MDYYFDIETGAKLTDDDMTERYDAMLDECHEEVTIGELSWSASYALKTLDPIAYRVGQSDFESAELDETIVEEGWFVRVLTKDGEQVKSEFFTDEDTAREYYDDQDEYLPQGTYSVMLYSTTDEVLAESFLTVE